MYLKNNKGVTVVSLIIVVVILVLLASITVYEANGLITITKKQSITTNLLLIQAKVRIINEQVVFEKDDEKKKELLVGTKLSEDASTLNSLKEKKVIPNEDTGENYYLLSQSDLDNMGLEAIDASDGYVVNYETEEIIYIYGVQTEGGVYLYKLSELNIQV